MKLIKGPGTPGPFQTPYVMRNILLCLLALFLFSCSWEKKRVTDAEDYERFLRRTTLVSDHDISNEMQFWQDRLKTRPGDEVSIVKLASLYSEKFNITGRYEDIRASDSLYHTVLSDVDPSAELLQALAANAITQHQFQQARTYAERALAIGNKKAASLLILSDIYLELGDVFRASKTLGDFKNKNSFAFLIRDAKIKDHKGHLDTAIVLMEKAYTRVKSDKKLAQWALSNLADMYGHAGRIEESYRSYLEVLQADPDNTYCLKGIAWILFSHEHDTSEAKRIINTIAARRWTPETHLILAEIAESEGDLEGKNSHITRFVSEVSRPGYKTMYNKYLSLIYAEDLGQPEVGLDIAEEEIMNRPTAQSYDLKAWSLYNLENFQGALAVAESHVEGHTYEPEALYHLGMICLANKQNERAEKYLLEALESEFELGPSTSSKIQEALKSI